MRAAPEAEAHEADKTARGADTGGRALTGETASSDEEESTTVGGRPKEGREEDTDCQCGVLLCLPAVCFWPQLNDSC